MIHELFVNDSNKSNFNKIFSRTNFLSFICNKKDKWIHNQEYMSGFSLVFYAIKRNYRLSDIEFLVKSSALVAKRIKFENFQLLPIQLERSKEDTIQNKKIIKFLLDNESPCAYPPICMKKLTNSPDFEDQFSIIMEMEKPSLFKKYLFETERERFTEMAFLFLILNEKIPSIQTLELLKIYVDWKKMKMNDDLFDETSGMTPEKLANYFFYLCWNIESYSKNEMIKLILQNFSTYLLKSSPKTITRIVMKMFSYGGSSQEIFTIMFDHGFDKSSIYYRFYLCQSDFISLDLLRKMLDSSNVTIFSSNLKYLNGMRMHITQSPLDFLCSNPKATFEMFALLIEKGAKFEDRHINRICKNNSLISSEKLKIVKILLENKCQPTYTKLYKNNTCLHALYSKPVSSHPKDLFKLLIEHKADVNTLDDKANKFFNIAYKRQSITVIEEIRKERLSLDFNYQNKYLFVNTSVPEEFLVNLIQQKGCSSEEMCYYIRRKQNFSLDLYKKMFEMQNDINTLKSQMHYACQYTSNKELINFLIKKGISINSLTEIKDVSFFAEEPRMWTPLDRLSRAKTYSHEFMLFLVESKAHISSLTFSLFFENNKKIKLPEFLDLIERYDSFVPSIDPENVYDIFLKFSKCRAEKMDADSLLIYKEPLFCQLRKRTNNKILLKFFEILIYRDFEMI